MKNKAAAVFFVFLCMGFADAAGPFVGMAKDTFNISNFLAQLISFAGLIMFGIISIPAGILQSRTGKKKIMLLGLVIAFAGMMIATVLGIFNFYFFLLVTLMLGTGAALLQVSGNPAIRDISPDSKYSRNLSFSQFIKSVGSLSGPVLLIVSQEYWNGAWQVVFPIFGTCLMITIIFVSFLKIDEKPSEAASLLSCLGLLRHKPVLLMVSAIFLYVGSEVCLSSEIPIYMKAQYGVDITTSGLLGTGIFFLSLTAGRFLGAVILNWLRPKVFFYLTAVISLLGVSAFFAGHSSIAYIGIVISGFGFANIFPLIFSITVDAMPNRANELSGLMVTAIVGGAVVPLLMGYAADITSPLVSFIVPLTAVITIILLVSFAKFPDAKITT